MDPVPVDPVPVDPVPVDPVPVDPVPADPVPADRIDAHRFTTVRGPRRGTAGDGRPVRRGTQLLAGLVLYGVSMAFYVRSGLGVMPWDVLHQGLAARLGVSLGVVTIGVGALVLLLWVPLRQRPGVGTVTNVIVIGVAVDVALGVLVAPASPPARLAFLLLGVGLNAVATAAYLGARLGPGPRDGLMTGLVDRTGWSVRVVRTGIEAGVVALGWLLGGVLGLGTVVYALCIGPLVHLLLPWLEVSDGERSEPTRG